MARAALSTLLGWNGVGHLTCLLFWLKITPQLGPHPYAPCLLYDRSLGTINWTLSFSPRESDSTQHTHNITMTQREWVSRDVFRHEAALYWLRLSRPVFTWQPLSRSWAKGSITLPPMWKCWRLPWDLLQAKQMFYHWARTPPHNANLCYEIRPRVCQG